MLHVWAENNPVLKYNDRRLEEINKCLFYLRAADQYPPNVSEQEVSNILARPRSETGGLDFEIKIKEMVRKMLTNNIDIADINKWSAWYSYEDKCGLQYPEAKCDLR